MRVPTVFHAIRNKMLIVCFQKILEGGGVGVKDPGNYKGDGGWTVNLVFRSSSIQYGFKI